METLSAAANYLISLVPKEYLPLLEEVVQSAAVLGGSFWFYAKVLVILVVFLFILYNTVEWIFG